MYVSTLHACLVSIEAKRVLDPLVMDGCEPYVVPKSNQVFYMSSQCPLPQSHLSRRQNGSLSNGAHEAISGCLDSKRPSEIKRASFLPLQSPLWKDGGTQCLAIFPRWSSSGKGWSPWAAVRESGRAGPPEQRLETTAANRPQNKLRLGWAFRLARSRCCSKSII